MSAELSLYGSNVTATSNLDKYNVYSMYIPQIFNSKLTVLSAIASECAAFMH